MKSPDLLLIGFAVILIGIFIVIIGSLNSSNSNSKVAVVGFFGPIPFGFGNDKPLMMWSLAAAMIIMLALYFFVRKSGL